MLSPRPVRLLALLAALGACGSDAPSSPGGPAGSGPPGAGAGGGSGQGGAGGAAGGAGAGVSGSSGHPGAGAAGAAVVATWERLDQWLDQRMAAGVPRGYALQVFGPDDALLHERAAGVCPPDAPGSACPAGSPAWSVDLVTGVASSTKWVTSTTVLSVLEEAVAQGAWSSLPEALDAPIGATLSCPGLAQATVGTITPRQLLSFTSGVVPHPCAGEASGAGAPDGGWTLGSCACAILTASEKALVASADACTTPKQACPPGVVYRYHSAHHTVAGALVEALAQTSWVKVFEARVKGPLGLAMGWPKAAVQSNLNLAGGVRASVADYARFVRAIAHDGRGEGPPLVLSKAAVEEQQRQQLGPGVRVAATPQPGMGYGLNNWRWCYRRPTDLSFLDDGGLLERDPTCSELLSVGHAGKGGYLPWVDLKSGVYGVFAMREPSPGGEADYPDAERALLDQVRTMVSLITSP